MCDIHLLADQPALIAGLAEAYAREWPGWYRQAGHSTTADLTARSRREGRPLGLVATEANVAVALKG